MPKENTHLWFAHTLLCDLSGTETLRCISCSLAAYLLGSVMPDTFYYASRPSLVRIAESFHGRDGNPTNTFVIRVLEESCAGRDVAFALGFLTHCALDIAFHPVIYYLSGNYYDSDPARRSGAVRAHRRLETSLDRSLGHRVRFHRSVRPRNASGLVMAGILGRDHLAGPLDIRLSIARQAAFNYAFTSRLAYRLALLASPTLVAPAYLGLFYADVPDHESFPSTIEARDLVDGTPYTTSVAELFGRARCHALSMMRSAFSFSRGEIGRETLLEAIPGVSLDTGRLGVSVDAIRHVSGD